MDIGEFSTRKKRIILTGGGTGGSVTPLLAITEEVRAGIDYLFVGSADGPEKGMAEKEGIPFKHIPSGKMRRYFSWRNFIDPFFILAGFFKALVIVYFYKPDLVITAGSFVSVPVIWAAGILRRKVLVHQQDVRPGLANRLMSPFARRITVTFEKSLGDYGKKALWIGNPTRKSLRLDSLKLNVEGSADIIGALPTILILGGGTGSLAINEVVSKCLDELTAFAHIIHQTGRGKGNVKVKTNYICYEFLHAKQLAGAYASADIIVSRCGMGTLTELAYLGKASILVPMPDSHQEENALFFKEKNAAIVIDQKDLTPERLITETKNLLYDKNRRVSLGNNIKMIMKAGANERIAELIREMIKD